MIKYKPFSKELTVESTTTGTRPVACKALQKRARRAIADRDR